MVVGNDLDRFHLFAAVIDLVPKLRYTSDYLKQSIRDKWIDHRQHITRHGLDLPEIRNWTWRG